MPGIPTDPSKAERRPTDCPDEVVYLFLALLMIPLLVGVVWCVWRVSLWWAAP